MKKKVIALCAVMVLTVFAGTSVYASDVEPCSAQASAIISVGGKLYTCRSTFTWTKSSDTLYYGGMQTNCKATTTRKNTLNVLANTAHNGYVTYTGTSTAKATGLCDHKKMVTVNQKLSGIGYKGFTGKSEYYYDGVLKCTIRLE